MNTNTRPEAAPSQARNFQDRKSEKPNRADHSILPAADSGNTPPRAIRRVLVTGATGYLGRSLCEVMAKDFDLIRMDIAGSGLRNGDAGQEILGSVTDRDLLDRACGQADALVLGHMFPNQPGAYAWPDECMDVNVKGVALALEAAARHHIKRVVLISSVAVVWGHVLAKTFLTNDLPPFPTNIYGMTKWLQENVAWYYHQSRGLEIAVLRPAHVLRGDSLVDKYGEKRDLVTWQCIDPRDIGRAAVAALRARELAFEKFHLMAGPDAENHADLDPAREHLGWVPQCRFEGLPVESVWPAVS
ncbi:MAG: NAD(P)-dependent oxidoreductase [Terrimicrobiaceae bacterium]